MNDHFSHSWLPYIYQYGLGAVIFIVGLIITLRSGSFDLTRRIHRLWLIVLMVGFVWFVTLHAAMTLAALGHERIALAGGAGVMLVTLVTGVVLSRRTRGRA
jgi:hypothetical protein